jgi:hypothetical protein
VRRIAKLDFHKPKGEVDITLSKKNKVRLVNALAYFGRYMQYLKEFMQDNRGCDRKTLGGIIRNASWFGMILTDRIVESQEQLLPKSPRVLGRKTVNNAATLEALVSILGGGSYARIQKTMYDVHRALKCL